MLRGACINRPRQLFLYCNIVLRTFLSSCVVLEIRERRGRDIPSCSHLHRPYGSKTSGSPFTSLQAHEQEHRGHHALHGHLDHGPGLRLCLWLFHVRLPWIAPQS